MDFILLSKEKWDSSGESEAVSRMAANSRAGTQEYIAVTSQQLFSHKKLQKLGWDCVCLF
jgi:hypothetical protein